MSTHARDPRLVFFLPLFHDHFPHLEVLVAVAPAAEVFFGVKDGVWHGFARQGAKKEFWIALVELEETRELFGVGHRGVHVDDFGELVDGGGREEVPVEKAVVELAPIGDVVDVL